MYYAVLFRDALPKRLENFCPHGQRFLAAAETRGACIERAAWILQHCHWTRWRDLLKHVSFHDVEPPSLDRNLKEEWETCRQANLVAQPVEERAP